MLVRRLDENRDMTFGQGLANYARDDEATAQAVESRLQMLLEEWFLDTGSGVPYFQQIFVKPTNLPLVESIIKKIILDTVGVQEIRMFSLSLDNKTRRVTIAATVANIYGTVSNIKVTK